MTDASDVLPLDPSSQRSLTVDLEYSLTMVTTSDGRPTVVLKDGAVRAGLFGEKESYLPMTLSCNGPIADIRVDFLGESTIEAYPDAFEVPGIIGGPSKGTHPAWTGEAFYQNSPRYELVRLSGPEAGGREGIEYSLKLFPITYLGSEGASVRSFARVTYTEAPAIVSPMALPAERKPVGDVRYIIITDEDLVDAVKPLAIWKSQKGVFTKLVTTAEISNMYTTGDIQSKMRRYVSEMEAAYDIDYLLLAGDYDLVRTRNTKNLYPESMYGEPSTFATDGYYSCVDTGTSWNSNGNTAYAEGGEIDDAIPDLAVGRIAINDPDILSIIVNDLIDRERNYQYSDGCNVTAFMAGDPQNVPGDPTDTMDFFWTQYAEGVFADRETLYYDGTGTMSFSSSSFRDVMDDGHQAMGYFAHGSQTGIPDLFSNSQVPTLSGAGADGSFFTMACLTAWFDDPNQGSMGSFTDCFAETMTETPKKGVVGYIGASRLAVGNIDTVYDGDAPGLEEDYWRAVRAAKDWELTPTVGDVYRETVAHFSGSFYPFPSSYYDYATQRTFLEYNLLGEPEAPLFLRPPKNLSIDFNVAPDGTWVLANVTDLTGAPVEGATVAVFRWLELGASGITGPDGTINISIPPSNGGVVNITASRVGDIPATGTFFLEDDLAPEGVFSIFPSEPDGWNDIYVTVPDVTLAGDEPVDVEYHWDDDAPTLVDGPCYLTALEGMHSMTFRAVDAAGHWSQPVHFDLTVDTTAPDLWIETYPRAPDGDAGFFVSRPMVSLNSSENISVSYVTVDDGHESTYDGPFFLNDGDHYVTIRALDMAGNVNLTDTLISVDLDRPYSSLYVSHEPDGEDNYYITPPSIYLEAEDENGATVLYRWDSGPWMEYTEPFSLMTGVHRLQYMARDTAGNNETTENFEWFRYDPSLPVVSVTIDPEGPDGTNGHYRTNPVVNITATDAVSEDLDILFVLCPPGQGFDWANDSVRPDGPLSIPDGHWLLYIMALDPAGNKRSLYPYEFDVDTLEPVMGFRIGPQFPDGQNGWYLTRPTLILEPFENDTIVEISEDRMGFVPTELRTIELPGGIHDIRFRPVDQAGNVGTISEFSYKCDLADPEPLLMLGNSTYYILEEVMLYAKGSFDENGIESYKFRSDDGYETLWTANSTCRMTFVNPGNHSLYVMVKDPSGRVNTSQPIIVRIIERPIPPEDNVTDDDDIIIGPDPDDDLSDDDLHLDPDLIMIMGVVAIIGLLATIVVVLLVRRFRIKDVEWEDDDEDDWLDEDWVDEDISEVTEGEIFEFSE